MRSNSNGDQTCKNIVDADFQSTVIEAKRPVVLDVWADGCGPCKMVGAGLSRIHAARPEAFDLVLANQADIPETLGKLDIRSSPTLILYVEGREIARRSGALIESQISNWLNAHLPERT